jgi:hypothetical protein
MASWTPLDSLSPPTARVYIADYTIPEAERQVHKSTFEPDLRA